LRPSGRTGAMLARMVLCVISIAAASAFSPTLARVPLLLRGKGHVEQRLLASRKLALAPSVRGRGVAHSGPAMVAEVPSIDIQHLSASIGMAQALVVETYMSALKANGAAVDSATAATLYSAGKLTSAAISKQRQTLRWLANWAAIGVVDGLCTHSWYHYIDGAVADLNLQLDHIPETMLLTFISSMVYTPLYCAIFLGLLSLVEGKGFKGAQERIEADFKVLIVQSTKIWGPFNFVLFGVCPLELRTLSCMAFHYVFLVGLALWDTATTLERAALSAAATAGVWSV
jgi:hypothetical protein